MKTRVCALIVGSSTWLSAAAWAQSAQLAPVERAYQDVDFPTTHDLARRALEAGGSTQEDTTRLYVLLGVSAAALGDESEAKQDFVAALAIDPTLKLEKSLSPKVREPYLEAEGYWSASAHRLTLSAKPASDGAHLIVRVTDPASMMSRVELHIGLPSAAARAVFSLDPSAVTRFVLPANVAHTGYEFALRAFDRYGNVLAEYGADADPIVVRGPEAKALPVQPLIAGAPRERSYVLPVSLGALGIGAAAAGIVFHVRRERAAKDWNGPSCEHPGQTRLAQCQNVDTRIRRDEALAVGFYAGAGALVLGSVVALLVGRAPEPEQAMGGLLGCSLNGPGIDCAGRF